MVDYDGLLMVNAEPFFPSTAFQIWVAEHGSRSGARVCNDCCRDNIPRASIIKAKKRMAGTQEKVARQKRAKIIAEVWAEITQKRKSQPRATTENAAKRPKCAAATPRPSERVGSTPCSAEDAMKRKKVVETQAEAAPKRRKKGTAPRCPQKATQT